MDFHASCRLPDIALLLTGLGKQQSRSKAIAALSKCQYLEYEPGRSMQAADHRGQGLELKVQKGYLQLHLLANQPALQGQRFKRPCRNIGQNVRSLASRLWRCGLPVKGSAQRIVYLTTYDVRSPIWARML